MRIAVDIPLLIFRPVVVDPTDALQEFCHDNPSVDEGRIMDPLIIAGKPVVCLLLQEIKNRDMPKRRYAIESLGHIGSTEAIKELELLLCDETEFEFIRADALVAIWQIDRSIGERHALMNRRRDDKVGYIARKLLEGNVPWLRKRTYADAVLARPYWSGTEP